MDKRRTPEQMLRKAGHPLRLVERGMARMQQLARRMIDIDQHGIEAARLRTCIEVCAEASVCRVAAVPVCVKKLSISIRQ